MSKANSYPARTLVNVYGEDANGAFGKSAIANSNLAASTDPTVNSDSSAGYSVGSLWQNASTSRVFIARSVAVGAAVWRVLAPGEHPGYIVGNWYVPDRAMNFTAGVAAGLGSIRIFPGFIEERVTLNSLGVRIVTTNAGNIQAAIYANNPATNKPTGNALASTASMSTAAATAVNAAVSVQLEPGMYWFGTNIDNNTAIPTNFSAGVPAGSFYLGSATQNDVLGQSTGLIGFSTPSTFGTWGDLTSATFTDVVNNSIPIVQFKVASVP